jgi:hypothetical protein
MEENKKPRPQRKNALLISLVLVLVAVAVLLAWHFKSQDSTSLPQSVLKSADFPVYYPSKLPSGYQLDDTSITVQKQTLFYNLKKDAGVIHISEQAAPEQRPDLKSIDGFGEVSSVAGQAVLGTVNGRSTGILLTKSTLVTINGSKDIPNEIIGTLVQNMNSVPR